MFTAPEPAKRALLLIIRREPRTCGIDRTRWRAVDLLTTCPWLQLTTPKSVPHLLKRLGISYKRGRDYVHSPDPDYQEKLDYVQELLGRVQASHGREVLLFQDEFTYYRHPTLAPAYGERGADEPRAGRSYRRNTATRVAATLHPFTGQVVAVQRSALGVEPLAAFYQQVRKAYPEAARLYVVQDNWTVHYHPDLLVALEPQEARWPYHRPPNWPTEPRRRLRERWEGRELPIQLIALPTYASWTNPIEKLWRKLRQEVLHLHRLSAVLPALRTRVTDFLEGFRSGSQALLRYVGLLTPD